MIRRRLAVVACCVLAACARQTGEQTETITGIATVPTTIELDSAGVSDAAVLDSTVRVRAAGCGPRTRLGLGTLVDESLVVTAAHVVAGSERVEVVDHTGATASADVVAFDPDQDLALLRADAPVGTVAVVRPDEPSAGDRGIVAVTDDGSGADHSLELVDATITRTVTVRTTDIYGDGVVLRDGFEIDASIEPGDSGTMVHFPDGVSGVVWARSLDAVDRAWAVTVPADLLDASRSASPVDTGPCP